MGRLILFTGKGGVGKTFLAISKLKNLLDSGEKALYVAFENQKKSQLFAELSLDQYYENLDVYECAKNYIHKKLGSKRIANWIISTTFFKATFNMVPGFSYVILLGQLIEKLKNDPELIIVLDAPSSGHTITMFESLTNFLKIFKTGILASDILELKEFWENPSNLTVNICTIPTQIAMQEAIELKNDLQNYKTSNITILLNNSFFLIKDLADENASSYLNKKIEMERNILKDFQEQLNLVVPHSIEQEDQDKIRQIASYLK